MSQGCSTHVLEMSSTRYTVDASCKRLTPSRQSEGCAPFATARTTSADFRTRSSIALGLTASDRLSVDTSCRPLHVTTTPARERYCKDSPSGRRRVGPRPGKTPRHEMANSILSTKEVSSAK